MSKNKKLNQKIRRWTYEAHVTMKDGQKASMPLQSFSIGTAAKSKESAASLLADLKKQPQFAEIQDLRVERIPHETITNHILSQIQGMDFELTVYRRSVQKLAEQIYDAAHPIKEDGKIFDDVADSARTQEVARTAGMAVITSRIELQKETLPHADQLASVEEVEEALNEEAGVAATGDVNDESEGDESKREVGLDALNKILDTQAEVTLP